MMIYANKWTDFIIRRLLLTGATALMADKIQKKLIIILHFREHGISVRGLKTRGSKVKAV